MAVNFIARKCACGGKLEFDASRKIWICKYCGTIVEREATFDKIHVDGIEGIGDVVRQTLLDVANQKMDSALRNLEDCERKDHKHIGTLLAHISYNLSVISLAKSQNEARISFDKVKIYTKRLQEEYPDIAEDEINLYESFGDTAADVYANLMVVFDTIGEQGRSEYISAKLRPEEVFSAYANKALLRISIKNGKYDVVDKIVNNISHVDRVSAMQEVLDKYPDRNEKRELIVKLFDVSAAEKAGKRYFESYFADTTDSPATRAQVVTLLNSTDIHCSADMIVKAAGEKVDSYQNARILFDAIYSVKISDQETEMILAFCLAVSKSYDVQSAFFDTLIDKKVFFLLDGKFVISFLYTSSFSIDKKVELLNKMLSFQIDSKDLDEICNYYLNDNDDDSEQRVKILEVLLAEGVPVSADTVRNYVIRTNLDAGNKKRIIERIFATGINKNFLGNLLSEYILNSSDSMEQKETIIQYLLEQGFKVDPDTLAKYVASDENSDVKLLRIKQMIANGTVVRAGTLDTYILSIGRPDDFSEDIFNVLTANGYMIGFQAYAKFVLECRDTDKVRHGEKLAGALNCDLGSQRIVISHLGGSVNCNIAQAYILNAGDGYDIARQLLQQMMGKGVKLNAEILLSSGRLKFKKYVGENKNMLSPLTLQLCEENRMFSLF
ncbi:MAG: hypothetical protein HDR26_06480 [Lachnospiraceae bacterium]|nr:hypothetical protein [Lachnospiraceae bacterium]